MLKMYHVSYVNMQGQSNGWEVVVDSSIGELTEELFKEYYKDFNDNLETRWGMYFQNIELANDNLGIMHRIDPSDYQPR